MNDITIDSFNKTLIDQWFNTDSISYIHNENFMTMGYGCLKHLAIKEIKPGATYKMQYGVNVEVLTYVIEGSVYYSDNQDDKRLLSKDMIHRVITQNEEFSNEFNAVDTTAKIIQLWIAPETNDVINRFDEISLREKFGCTDIVLAVSGSGRTGSMNINQDIDLFVGNSNAEGEKHIKTFKYRKAWIQLIDGEVSVNGESLKNGEGFGLEGVEDLHLNWKPNTHFILIDLPN